MERESVSGKKKVGGMGTGIKYISERFQGEDVWKTENVMALISKRSLVILERTALEMLRGQRPCTKA